MLAWTITKVNGDNKPNLPKSLIHIISTFCEGYGIGFVGIVIKSPHKHLINQTVKVDMRNKYLNQYFTKICKTQKLKSKCHKPI